MNNQLNNIEKLPKHTPDPQRQAVLNDIKNYKRIHHPSQIVRKKSKKSFKESWNVQTSARDLQFQRFIISKIQSSIKTHKLILTGYELSQAPFPDPRRSMGGAQTNDLKKKALFRIPPVPPPSLWLQMISTLTHLNLSDNQLTSLPASIGSLKQLVSLNLRRNGLRFLPPSIADLVNLSIFDVRCNFLRQFLGHNDDINSPSRSDLVNLQQLSVLLIANNRLTALPTHIGLLSNLTHLDISNNPISQLPQSMTRLYSLERLECRSTGFIQFPAAVYSLPALVKVSFMGCRTLKNFSPLPPRYIVENVLHLNYGLRYKSAESSVILMNKKKTGSIGFDLNLNGPSFTPQSTNLSTALSTDIASTSTSTSTLHNHQPQYEFIGLIDNITILNLSYNSLQSLPGELACLIPKLDALNVSYNKLLSFPPSFCFNSPQITTVDLSNNNLVAFPGQLGTWPWRSDFSFDVSAVIPWSKLIRLDLSDNQLKIIGPSTFDCCESLLELDLSHNQLTALPSSLPKCCKLNILVASHNQLTTSGNGIDIDWSKLKNLRSLNLAHNFLEKLPKSMAQLSNLQNLSIRSNHLVQFDSILFQGMVSLQRLISDHNKLVSLPKTIGNLKLLEALYLESNNLEFLPNEIGECGRLRHIYLAKNNLASIPRQVALGPLRNSIQRIDFFDNPRLHGTPLMNAWLHGLAEFLTFLEVGYPVVNGTNGTIYNPNPSTSIVTATTTPTSIPITTPTSTLVPTAVPTLAPTPTTTTPPIVLSRSLSAKQTESVLHHIPLKSKYSIPWGSQNSTSFDDGSYVSNGGSVSFQLEQSISTQSIKSQDTAPNMPQSQSYHLSDWHIEFKSLKFQNLIGEGAFGQVFSAKWNSRQVAVKTLKSKTGQLLFNESVLYNLRREVGLLSRAKHPHIVELLGVCLQPPKIAIVTEFVRGYSLRHLIKNLPSLISPMWLRTIPLHVARGMNYLHSLNVVHRDLSSRNILIALPSGYAKVCDFGLARPLVLDPKTRGHSIIPSSGTIAGSVRWTAPEVLRCEHYNEKADVYSFAIVLWELLTKLKPYATLSSAARVAALVAYHGTRPDSFTATDLSFSDITGIRGPSFPDLTLHGGNSTSPKISPPLQYVPSHSVDVTNQIIQSATHPSFAPLVSSLNSYNSFSKASKAASMSELSSSIPFDADSEDGTQQYEGDSSSVSENAILPFDRESSSVSENATIPFDGASSSLSENGTLSFDEGSPSSPSNSLNTEPINFEQLDSQTSLAFAQRKDIKSFPQAPPLPPPLESTPETTRFVTLFSNQKPEIQARSSHPHWLYSLMRLCWSEDPGDRPSFSEIIRYIEHHLAVENDQSNFPSIIGWSQSVVKAQIPDSPFPHLS